MDVGSILAQEIDTAEISIYRYIDRRPRDVQIVRSSCLGGD